MPRSTTRAGLTPRLFTSNVTALPRTPESYGFFAGSGAPKGYPDNADCSFSAAQRYLSDGSATNRQCSRRCEAHPAARDDALACGRASGAAGAVVHFGNLGTSKLWI